MSERCRSLTLSDRFERAVKRHAERGDYTHVVELSEDVRRQFGIIRSATQGRKDEREGGQA